MRFSITGAAKLWRICLLAGLVNSKLATYPTQLGRAACMLTRKVRGRAIPTTSNIDFDCTITRAQTVCSLQCGNRARAQEKTPSVDHDLAQACCESAHRTTHTALHSIQHASRPTSLIQAVSPISSSPERVVLPLCTSILFRPCIIAFGSHACLC